jgi:hypothetical protein
MRSTRTVRWRSEAISLSKLDIISVPGQRRGPATRPSDKDYTVYLYSSHQSGWSS